MLKLTKENYYTAEADREYMSVSQYKNFVKCEAMAMARINGELRDEKSDALLLGSYVHSWSDGTMEQFKSENPELFSTRGATKGQLKATFQIGDLMIKTLENDKMAMFALQGDKEIIMTGELFGLPWKIRMDVYNPQFGRFADLKTVADLYKKQWHEEYGYCSFVEAYGYITQMGVYSEIERQNRGGDKWLENYIVAVSKETPPNKEIITIDHDSLTQELEKMEGKMKRIKLVKLGQLDPRRCEKCEYCRRTKQIRSVIHYSKLTAGA